jgi:hypothetical protein
MLVADPDGSVDLYFAGAKSMATAIDGVEVHDNDGADPVMSLHDSNGAQLSRIMSNSDDLYLDTGLQSTANAIFLRSWDGTGWDNLFAGTQGGAVELYHTGLKVFETHVDGIVVRDGSGAAPYASFNNSDGAALGTIQMTTGKMDFQLSGEAVIQCNTDGSVDLYYDGVKTAETLDDGWKVTGALTLNEITTPTADPDFSKIYTKSDNKLYVQTGDGVEHEIAFA